MPGDYDLSIPHAGAMIQSLRALGYDLTTAIADLIDNSVAANAKNVWIEFSWNGEESRISILDDGNGMNEGQLINAMRLGSQSPLVDRDPKDLGRFGLGLKTASFSQCRRLTVKSKQNGASASLRSWDLDYVTQTGEWRLLKTFNPEVKDLLNQVDQLTTGTVVVWENIDRLVANTNVDNIKDMNLFLEKAEQVKNHIAMVYHRLLDRPGGLKIYINSRPIKPWDPFVTYHKATRLLTDEPLTVSGKRLSIRPYVLPHHSKMNKDEHKLASGVKGWNGHQGFYVYRNKRMLVDGDWLGLGFQKEEHCKLARIMVDIPNDMDSEWEIDVKKSRAKPPAQVREDLKRIAKLTRGQATEIYRHRGKVVSRRQSAEHVFLWEAVKLHGKTYYRINRNHPLIKAVKSGDSSAMETVLRLLEETVPVPLIALNSSSEPDKQGGPFDYLSTAKISEMIKSISDSLINQGYSIQETQEMLLVMEPFSQYMGVVQSHFDKEELNDSI